jgi:ParB family chromosome partitioning protein
MIGIAWLAKQGGKAVAEKRRLGRGLDALLGGAATADPALESDSSQSRQAPQVPVDQIRLNPRQPRKDFDPDELAALQQSLSSHGLLQPIVVRETPDGYELIAGERRLRAARECGWREIPVHVVDYNEQQSFEASLVENLQRADLNPIEKAQGFREYMQLYGVTHDDLARKMGLDRSTITNLVRLLELPPEVQDFVRLGQISNGHARALLAFGDSHQQIRICNEIISKGLSVRAVEAMTKVEPEPSGGREPPLRNKSAHVQGIEDELRQLLATKVEVRVRGQDRGQFVIDFETNDDFERILAILRH